MKCIYCGKEITTGSMCEECSSKRKELLGFNVSNINSPNPNPNIQSSNVTQKLYCRYCGSALNNDGTCPNHTCQKQREKEADKNTHFAMSLISAIFSSLYNAYFVFWFFLFCSILISEKSGSSSGGEGTVLAFLLIPLIYLFIPEIISCILSIKAILAYSKYKDEPISKARKILNFINIVNFFISTVGLILLIVIIL